MINGEKGRNVAHVIMRTVFVLDKVADSILRKKTKLTLSQLKIMMSLSDNAHYCQREVAGFLGVTEAAVSRQMDVMRKKGLLSKKKATCGHISILGKKEFMKSILLLDEVLENGLMGINDKEMQNIVKSLRIFIANLVEKYEEAFQANMKFKLITNKC